MRINKLINWWEFQKRCNFEIYFKYVYIFSFIVSVSLKGKEYIYLINILKICNVFEIGMYVYIYI